MVGLQVLMPKCEKTMPKKFLFCLFVFFVVIISVACPRYKTVRETSTEQLNVQIGFKSNLTEYLKQIEIFVDNQVKVSKFTLEQLKGDVDENIRSTAELEINQIPVANVKERNDRRERIGRDLLANSQEYEARKKNLDDLCTQLKAKHKEMLEAYQVIVEAQTELDRYIQLKKFDEVIFEKILGKLKVNQEKFNNKFNQATDILGKILKPPSKSD